MRQLTAKALAEILPTNRYEKEVIFQVEASLDGGFEDESGDFAEIVNLDELPAQVSRRFYKSNNDVYWMVGVNIWEDGFQTRYQSFFWLLSNKDDTVPMERLSANGDWQKVGAVCALDGDQSEISTATIPEYPWLIGNARPVDVDFKLEVVDQEAASHEPLEDLLLLKSAKVENNLDVPVTYRSTVTYEKEQVATTSVTDKHSVKVGLEVSYGLKVSWFGFADASFSIKGTLEYGYERSTTTSSSDSQSYGHEDEITVEVEPHGTKYIVMQVMGDEMAKADLLLDFRLSGSLDGVSAAPEYLRDVILAQDPDSEVVDEGDGYIVYRVTSIVDANLVSDVNTKVYDTEPDQSSGLEDMHYEVDKYIVVEEEEKVV